MTKAKQLTRSQKARVGIIALIATLALIAWLTPSGPADPTRKIGSLETIAGAVGCPDRYQVQLAQVASDGSEPNNLLEPRGSCVVLDGGWPARYTAVSGDVAEIRMQRGQDTSLVLWVVKSRATKIRGY